MKRSCSHCAPELSNQHSAAAIASRRHMLQSSAVGFGYLALSSLLGQEAIAEDATNLNPLAARAPHFAPRAKRIVFLFMKGGPSHVDTFDPNHSWIADHGKPHPLNYPKCFSRRKAIC